MPYITYNGQLYAVTQAQYDSYTVGAVPPASATNLTAGLANDLPLAVPAGGTVLGSNSATTPILTPNTSVTIPGQTLTTTVASVVTPDIQKLIDSGLYDPGIGFNANGQPVTSATPVSSSTGGLGYVNTGNTTGGLGYVNTSATPVTPGAATGSSAYNSSGDLLPGYQLDENNNPVFVGQSTTTTFNPDGTISTGNAGAGGNLTDAAAGSSIQNQVQNAQAQQTIANQRKQINNGDWRVRLRLAPQSTYLYNAPSPGILQPLKTTDGVIFPYTPTISTSYRATYSPYDLTHSNYRGYWYQNSYVDAINLSGTFTAQDTTEANYLLAVIHFFRSSTKMFYGQDAERGSPPPLVYLSGFGDYQFREHACVISQFNYTLPQDVDYIRAGSPNNVGLNLTSIRDRQNVATNSVFGSLNRLAAAFLTKGGVSGPPAPPTLGLNRPTYVPTKMEIQLTLMPMQSRQQISQQFSLKEFANGNLLKGGFW